MKGTQAALSGVEQLRAKAELNERLAKEYRRTLETILDCSSHKDSDPAFVKGMCSELARRALAGKRVEP